MRVTLVHSPAPREANELELALPEGASVREALERAGWQDQLQGLAAEQLTAGIWGRKTTADAELREGDRLEIYRGLRVDPKVARRERFVGQGARGAGLFSKRRPNSKAGY
ncbi:RnfH family protein [Hydrogenophaga sp. RWCD_12]|uniref:RnfH family protein n=1 Tax=Hydrogenophaga sp. RWCD_12 TaxID=3391190 RepID=UPI0039853FC9